MWEARGAFDGGNTGAVVRQAATNMARAAIVALDGTATDLTDHQAIVDQVLELPEVRLRLQGDNPGLGVWSAVEIARDAVLRLKEYAHDQVGVSGLSEGFIFAYNRNLASRHLGDADGGGR